MRGPLFQFLANDHARLAALLERAKADAGTINYDAYAEFRAGLLKHIAMEEKILLPAARRLRGGEALPIADKLRRDHGALAALLVPTPTPAIIAKIHAILVTHNDIEEGSGGVYEVCEKLAGDEAESLVAEMRRMSDIKLAPHVDGPQVMEATRRALERAGYCLEEKR
jgi:hemerythrin HHE cation binding domain-containing protein